MRIIFMGTPDFAAASLKKLIENNFEVVAVFSQPDKPKGRGMSTTFSPVKTIALENSIPIFQPEKLRDGTAYKIIKDLAPDILVVVAYGRILPDDILAIPKYGAVNVHGSLLPKYRGAAPIQAAILNGDEYTGVTTMYLSHDMDAGDIIYSEKTQIGEYETSGELFDRLKILGADLLIKTLQDIRTGSAPRIAQNHGEATYASMLEKSDCPIDWNNSPRAILKKIYALQPWPVATAEIDGTILRVFGAKYIDVYTKKAPGSIIQASSDGIEMACADGDVLLITDIQAPGKKRMSVADYIRGHKIKVDN